MTAARILVVDDVEFNIKLLDARLKQEYYQVYTATNGHEAIAKAKEIKPDIILMDVMMPGMNGIEAITILRQDPQFAHVRIIVITALNEPKYRVAALEAGADDFLTKPINDQALMIRVRSLIRLKLMDDELRLRDENSREFGISMEIEIAARNNIAGNVLVVDDDVIQYEKIATKLKTKSIDCYRTETIDALLAGEDKTTYKLFIINTLIWNVDPLSLCSRLKSDDRFRYTPILILMDENDQTTLSKALDVGINDYLMTPIDPSELLARCSTQIRRKNYHDALKQNYIHKVQHDELTSLYNRRYLETHIRNRVENPEFNSRPSAFMIADIDLFKKINDTYGHQVGDEVLRQIAKTFGSVLRAEDLCARYGGEEFVIVLPAVSQETAYAIAERIRITIAEQKFAIPMEPKEIHCTISIGVSFVKEGDTFDKLLYRADRNLYAAKSAGRNKVIIEEDVPPVST